MSSSPLSLSRSPVTLRSLSETFFIDIEVVATARASTRGDVIEPLCIYVFISFTSRPACVKGINSGTRFASVY